MDARQELANNHGENFADEFDAEFDLDDTTEEELQVATKQVLHRRLSQQLLTILSSTAVFYVVGLLDGILVAVAVMRYFGG